MQGIPIEYVDILMNNGFPKSKIDKISGNTLSVNVFRSIIKDLKKVELI